MTRTSQPFLLWVQGAHPYAGGTIAVDRDTSKGGFGPARRLNLGRSIRGKIDLGIDYQATCDKAASAAAVMLHLRSCYVSKAAILTVLVQLVLVENRSPA